MRKIFLIAGVCLSCSISAQYNALLWRISGNGLKQPSYVYGTMHTSDARVFEFGDSVLSAFDRAKTYAMELDPKEAFDLGLIPKLMMGKGYSLRKMIPDKDYEFLDSVVKKEVGFSVALFDNVSPVLTMMILEMSSMELEKSNEGNKDVLDLYFYKKAKKGKKKIIGIETVDEQLNALNSLTYEEQADLLVNEIHSLQQNHAQGLDVVKFYLSQNLDSLSANELDAQMPEKFYKAIVTDRNINMADRIAQLVKEQPAFIAIGALHLVKNTGVVQLLREKGFTVEAVR
jgi:uncharacterized protein